MISKHISYGGPDYLTIYIGRGIVATSKAGGVWLRRKVSFKSREDVVVLNKEIDEAYGIYDFLSSREIKNWPEFLKAWEDENEI